MSFIVPSEVEHWCHEVETLHARRETQHVRDARDWRLSPVRGSDCTVHSTAAACRPAAAADPGGSTPCSPAAPACSHATMLRPAPASSVG